LQPIREIGALCRERGILFHTDAVQAVGHVSVDVVRDNIDMLSLSGHKFHAPKGVGAMYCRKGIKLKNLIEGGAQERGLRGGTEAIPGILAMAAALKESCEHLEENAEKVTAMRAKLIEGLSRIPCSRCNGDPDHKVPGIVSFCFEGIEGESLLLRLDMAGICASSGSACTSGSLDPSHVLLALGMPHEIAHGSLRLSLCEYNTMEEVDYILEQVPQDVVHFLHGVVLAQAQAQGAVGDLMGHSQGQQHVAGVQAAAGAGAAGAGADAGHVQAQQQALPLDALKADADDAGDLVVRVTVAAGAGDPAQT